MSIQSEIDRINTAVSDQESLIGEIVAALAERCVVTEPILQAKTVTPSKVEQTVTADTGYDGLSSVTVEAAQGGEGTYGWKKCVSKLPSGYTEVEYLQSSGTQYIDTGFKPKNNTRVVCDFQLTDTTSFQYLFCARGAATSYPNRFGLLWRATFFRSDYGSTNLSFPTTVVAGDRQNVDFNGAICSIDGVVVEHTSTTFTSSYNLYLFTGNTAGSLDVMAFAKIYSCQIYDNGTLIRDFVPCTNASGTAGLYDLVNGVFYGNAGSGTFAVGSTAASPSAIDVVGYVVSDDSGAYPDGGFLDGYYYEKLVA